MNANTWHQEIDRLAPAWLRRGVVTPQDVSELHERGQTSWSADRLYEIAYLCKHRSHWLPLWWRRRRNLWGERS